MINYLKNKFFILAIAIATLFSCENDFGTVGIETLPDGELISAHSDTLYDINLVTLSQSKDMALQTTLPLLFGKANTPNGTIEAAMYVPLYNFLDSLKLQSENLKEARIYFKDGTPYSGDSVGYFYGNTSEPLNIQIYELQTELSDSTYINLELSEEIMASATLIHSFTHTPSTGEDSTLHSYLLPKEFGDMLFSKVKNAYSIYENYDIKYRVDSLNNYFKKQFKGLILKVSDSQESASLINLAALGVTFIMDGTSAESFSLGPDINRTRSTNPMHAYSLFSHHFNESTQTMLGKETELSYVLSLKGLKTVVNLESLKPWQDSAINSASLHIPIRFNNIEAASPTILKLYIYADEGEKERSLLFTTTTSLDIKNSVCVFDLAQFALGYLTSKDSKGQKFDIEDFHFEIVPERPENIVTSCELLNTPENRMFVKLVYTRF